MTDRLVGISEISSPDSRFSSRPPGLILPRSISSIAPPTYEHAEDLYQTLKANGRSPVRSSRVIVFSDIKSTESGYNSFPVAFKGRAKLIGRFESKDPGNEISSVISADPGENGWVLNGLYKDRAQDPAVALYNDGKIAFTYVGIDPSEKDPLKVGAYRVAMHDLDQNFAISKDPAFGPEGEKDSRFCYMDNNRAAIAARERIEIGDKVDSYFTIQMLKAPQNLAEMAQNITRVRRNPKSRVDLLMKDSNLWVGPNGLYPVSDTEVIMLFHTGRYTGVKQSNGLEGRSYSAFLTMITFNRETGYVEDFTRPQIIATVHDMPTSPDQKQLYEGPKRVDVRDVLFPTGFFFVIDNNGKIVSRKLVAGVGDSASVAMEIREGVFPKDIDPKLNPLSIIPEENVPHLLKLAA